MGCVWTLLLTLCALCPVALGGSLARPDLPYQAHSFNDLGAWRQLLLKGTGWFKVDVVLATQDACQGFSTWAGPTPERPCYQFKTLNVCCLALRGDTSSAPKLNVPFNTTDDLLGVLSDTDNIRRFFSDATQPVRISLDFDHMTPWDYRTDNVRFMFQDFLLDLGAVIAKYNLSVQIVYDFLVNEWAGYIDNQCASDPSSCSPNDVAMMKLPFLSQAGGFPDPSADPFHRYQVINTQPSALPSMCSSPDAWYPTRATLPYLFWEPSTQKDIVSLLTQYNQCSAVPASHADLRYGLRVTCNQEPDMFEVFAAKQTQSAANTLVEPLAVTPRMIVLPRLQSSSFSATTAAADRAIASAPQLMATTFGANATYWLRVSALADDVLSPQLPTPLALVELAGLAAHDAIVGLSTCAATVATAMLGVTVDTVPVVAVSGLGAYWSLSVNLTSGATAIVQSGQLTATTVWSSQLICDGASMKPTQIVTVQSQTDCSVALATWSTVAASSSSSSSSLSLLDTTCVEKDMIPTGATVSLVHSPQQQQQQQQQQHDSDGDDRTSAVTAVGNYTGLLLFASTVNVTAASTEKHIYGAAVDLTLLYSPTAVDQPLSPVKVQWLITHHNTATAAAPSSSSSFSSQSSWQRLDFGTAPVVQAFHTPSGPFAINVQTDGSCGCGFAINNNDMNHCDVFRGTVASSAALRSVSALLNYNYGALSAWRAALVAGDYMSMCHKAIIHGKFDSGLWPSVAVVAAPSSSSSSSGSRGDDWVYAAVELHDAQVTPPPLTTAVCGLPVMQPGLVLDAWRLPAPASLL